MTAKLALRQKCWYYASEAVAAKGGLTMADKKPKDEKQDERNEPFERFEQFVKKIAQVPKEEVDKKRAEREREKRAG